MQALCLLVGMGFAQGARCVPRYYSPSVARKLKGARSEPMQALGQQMSPKHHRQKLRLRHKRHTSKKRASEQNQRVSVWHVACNLAEPTAETTGGESDAFPDFGLASRLRFPSLSVPGQKGVNTMGELYLFLEIVALNTFGYIVIHFTLTRWVLRGY